MDRPAQVMSIPAEKPTGPAQETLRLVLVEDDPQYAFLVAEMLADAFGRERIELAVYSTVAAATECLAGIDCALVDLSLPDAAGLDVVERVQETAPGLAVIVLTGAEDEDLALR